MTARAIFQILATGAVLVSYGTVVVADTGNAGLEARPLLSAPLGLASVSMPDEGWAALGIPFDNAQLLIDPTQVLLWDPGQQVWSVFDGRLLVSGEVAVPRNDSGQDKHIHLSGVVPVAKERTMEFCEGLELRGPVFSLYAQPFLASWTKGPARTEVEVNPSARWAAQFSLAGAPVLLLTQWAHDDGQAEFAVSGADGRPVGIFTLSLQSGAALTPDQTWRQMFVLQGDHKDTLYFRLGTPVPGGDGSILLVVAGILNDDDGDGVPTPVEILIHHTAWSANDRDTLNSIASADSIALEIDASHGYDQDGFVPSPDRAFGLKQITVSSSDARTIANEIQGPAQFSVNARQETVIAAHARLVECRKYDKTVAAQYTAPLRADTIRTAEECLEVLP